MTRAFLALLALVPTAALADGFHGPVPSASHDAVHLAMALGPVLLLLAALFVIGLLHRGRRS